MAIGYAGLVARANDKTSDDELVLTVLANDIAVAGGSMFLRASLDNPAATVGNQDTTLADTVTDSRGNTWVKRRERAGTQGNVNQTSILVEFRCLNITTSLQENDTITLTLTAETVARAVVVEAYTVPLEEVDFEYEEGSGGIGSVTVPASGSLPSQEYLARRTIAQETSNTSFTPTSTWTALTTEGTSGSGAGTNQVTKAEHLIATATSFTSAPTGGNVNHASMLIVYQEAVAAEDPELEATAARTIISCPEPAFDAEEPEPEVQATTANTRITTPDAEFVTEQVVVVDEADVQLFTPEPFFETEEAQPEIQADAATAIITAPEPDLAAEPALDATTASATISAPNADLATEPTLDAPTAPIRLVYPEPSFAAEPIMDADVATTIIAAPEPSLTADVVADAAITIISAPTPDFLAEPALDADVARIPLATPSPDFATQPTLDAGPASIAITTPAAALEADAPDEPELTATAAPIIVSCPEPAFAVEPVLDATTAPVIITTPLPSLNPAPVLVTDIDGTRSYDDTRKRRTYASTSTLRD